MKHGCSLVAWGQLPGSLETAPCMGYRHHYRLLTCAAAALPTCHTGCVDGAGMWCDTLFSFSGVHLSFWWQAPSLYSRTLSCGLSIYTITFRPCGEVKKKTGRGVRPALLQIPVPPLLTTGCPWASHCTFLTPVSLFAKWRGWSFAYEWWRRRVCKAL